MKNRILPVAILLGFIFICDVYAQNEPSLSQLNAWESFNQKYNNKWRIRWDEETGIPRHYIWREAKFFLAHQNKLQKNF